MENLRDLYQEVILDHNRKPRNFGTLPDATHEAEGYNPLCGDRLHLFLKVRDGRIEDVRFEGSGCAISRASASMMTASVKGKSAEEVRRMFESFHQMVSREAGSAFKAGDLGKLAVFQGVTEYPARVKCATLAWHTLRSGLEGQGKAVSTE